jgi:S-adenosylmethionine:diacylglycerol 3-amino-3-carboxypropyl transferase
MHGRNEPSWLYSQDRTFEPIENALRRIADKHSALAETAEGSHHDQVDVMVLDELRDRKAWVALNEMT